MDDWLREFVDRHRAAQLGEDPRLAQILEDAGGMHLYGTIGADVFLRPDGSTVGLTEGSPNEAPQWVTGTPADRIADLVIGSRKYPELTRLLPTRPAGVPDCTACAGSGRLFGIVCAACSGLGWSAAPAT